MYSFKCFIRVRLPNKTGYPVKSAFQYIIYFTITGNPVFLFAKFGKPTSGLYIEWSATQ
jgi:hypothetical protein